MNPKVALVPMQLLNATLRTLERQPHVEVNDLIVALSTVPIVDAPQPPVAQPAALRAVPKVTAGDPPPVLPGSGGAQS